VVYHRLGQRQASVLAARVVEVRIDDVIMIMSMIQIENQGGTCLALMFVL
jgi:hypothetical protein